MWHWKWHDGLHTSMRANRVVRKFVQKCPSLSLHIQILAHVVISVNAYSPIVAADDFPPGYDQIRDEGTNEPRRGTINFIGAGVSVADDSANNETEVTITGGAGAGTVETIGDCNGPDCFEGTEGTTLTPFGGTLTLSGDVTISQATPSLLLDPSSGTTAGLHMDAGGVWWLGDANGQKWIVFEPDGDMEWPQLVSCAAIATNASGVPRCTTAGAGSGTVTSITAGTGLTGGTITSTGTIAMDTPVSVANGGTGATSLTDGGLLLGSGTGAITALGVAANGAIPMGDGTTDPVLNEIDGTANQVIVTNGAGTITLSTPQDLATSSSPTFANLLLAGTGPDARFTPTGGDSFHIGAE